MQSDDEIRELAAQIVKLGDLKDKRVFLEALVWAVAGSIWHAVEADEREQAMKIFAANLPRVMAAYAAGQSRKPS